MYSVTQTTQKYKKKRKEGCCYFSDGLYSSYNLHLDEMKHEEKDYSLRVYIISPTDVAPFSWL
jgi:hypothetical protein